MSNKHWHNNPLVMTGERGFGRKLPNSGGFDRCDGGSVNRFINIEKKSVIYKVFCQSKKFYSLTPVLFGMVNKPAKYYMYELVHGDEQLNPDVQRDMHKDTFHHTFKMWFYIDDVDEQHGSTEFIVHSHHSNLRRLVWEYQESLRKCSQSCSDKGGSFRIDKDGVTSIGYSPAKKLNVSKNTLVILNTKGFHRRGLAVAGTIRRGLYANFRPLAFLPFIH